MRFVVKIPKNTRLFIVGDIHEHEEQFDKLLEEVKPSAERVLVSVGDIYDKGYGVEVAESIVDKLKPYIKAGHAYIIKGNHELNNIRYHKRKKTMTEHLRWFHKQPLSLSFEFSNRTIVTVVHGGVKPSHTWDDLATSVETCYIRQIDSDGNYVKRKRTEVDGKRIMVPEKPGTVWHDLYDGRFGYIVSGHDSQKDGIAKFYNYSCNLDTAVYHTGKLTAQVFSEGLRKELLTFYGIPKYPDLDELYRLMAQGRV